MSPAITFDGEEGSVAQKSRPTVAVLSLFVPAACGHVGDPAFAQEVSIVRCNHANYCAHHGYTYVNPTIGSAAYSQLNRQHGTHAKVDLILQTLQAGEFDWLLWLDIDAVFYRRGLSIEYWIEIAARRAAHIVAAADIRGFPFNGGAMLIKSSSWSQHFFTRANHTLRWMPHDSLLQDQPGYYYMLNSDLFNESRRIYIVSPRARFQAFTKLNETKSAEWIVHSSRLCEAHLYGAHQCSIRTYVERECLPPHASGSVHTTYHAQNGDTAV